MSTLEHATYVAPGFDQEKRELGAIIQHEIIEAKRIQQETGCSWNEALRLAYQRGRET